MISSRKSDKFITAPIDQFGRYALVSAAIEEQVRIKKQKNVKVLDIGGFKGLTNDFLSNANISVTVVDLYDSDDKNYVKASALELPFKDNEFDYVVTFEVLEHISRADRENFISEALRVSKDSLLITAPFAGAHKEVAKTEVLVNDFWKHIYKKDHPWLEEHITNVIPDNNDLEEIFKRQKVNFISIGNNPIENWNFMVTFNFLTTLFRPSGENDQIHEFYNRNADVLESGETVSYRNVYIASKDKIVMPDAWKPSNFPENERTLKHIELINEIFKKIASDVLDLKKQHEKELRRLSKQLESRIQLHDALAIEADRIARELQKLHNRPIMRLQNKVTRIAKGKK